MDPRRVPTVPVEIDWDHPLAKSLQSLYIPGSPRGFFDYATIGGALVRNVPPTMGGNIFGPGLVTDGLTWASFGQNAPYGTGSASLTVIAELTTSTSGTALSVVIGSDNPSGWGLSVQTVNNNWSAALVSGSGPTQYNALTSISALNAPAVVSSVYSGATPAIIAYVDGALISTTTASAPPRRDASYSTVGGYVYGNALNPSYAFKGIVNAWWIHDVALTAGVAEWLGREPFAMLRPIRRRVFYGLASGNANNAAGRALLAALRSSGTGTATNSGSSAAKLGALSSVGRASATNTASSASQLFSLRSADLGSLLNLATATGKMSALISSGAVSATDIATGAPKLYALVSKDTGAAINTGAGDPRLDALLASGQSQPATGATGAGLLGALRASGSPTSTNTVAAHPSLGALRVSGSVSSANSATGTPKLFSLEVAGSSLPRQVGTGAVTLGALSVRSTGQSTNPASTSAHLGALLASASTTALNSGAGSTHLSALQAKGLPLETNIATGTGRIGALEAKGVAGHPPITAIGTARLGTLAAQGLGSFANTSIGRAYLKALQVYASSLPSIQASGGGLFGAFSVRGFADGPLVPRRLVTLPIDIRIVNLPVDK